jgi:putative membrane protein
MTSVVLRSVPIALALTMLSAASWAQTSTPPGSGTSMTGNQAAPAAQPGTGTRNAETRKDDQLARADRKFIQQAAEGGMYEVQIAQLAASKATDANVKSFADTLVKDHQAANNELVQMANAKKVELPAAPPRAMRRDIERLAQRKGKDFDEHFVREVGIKDHEKDIKMFEKGSGSVKDAQLKAWIDKTLPHLREHLAIAQKLPQAGRGAVDASSMGNRAAPKSGG